MGRFHFDTFSRSTGWNDKRTDLPLFPYVPVGTEWHISLVKRFYLGLTFECAFVIHIPQVLTNQLLNSGRGGTPICSNCIGMCRCTGYVFKPFCQELGIDIKLAFVVKGRVSNLSKFRINCFAKAQFRNRRYFVKTQRPVYIAYQ